MMKRWSVAVLVLVLLGAAMSAAAQVAPCPVPPPCPIEGPCPIVECWTPGVSTNPEWLKIDHHRVDVTIADRIARTSVDLEFVNDGTGMAEGTFIFPLPAGASVDSLTMYINDQPVEARILDADEARSVYDEIVRQYRDPALLEYVGTGAIQANVFPIPPGETRRIELTYSQALEADNGLVHYIYPLDVTALTTRRPIEDMSIHVHASEGGPIRTVYSPSHDIAVAREGESAFSAGFESTMFNADRDFSLYYGIDSDAIAVNALTYRAGSNEDGYFMLLVQPPLSVPDEQVQPQDVILVLDQSGSMQGDKWVQAQDAARYVLENLGAQDRFNAILFSTGVRTYSNQLEPANLGPDAAGWIDGQFAEGGTNINDALQAALSLVDAERPTTILFMTDGLPTEGEMNPEQILANLQADAPANARVFTFGVGDDVDPFLLDAISSSFDGASSYVRPSERIDEEIASLYNKLSAPVLQDATITINGLTTDSLYPQPPVDLFAGSQLTLVGRYRDGLDNATVTLSGMLNGEPVTYIYEGLDFRSRAGGEPFVSQLWATRRIGDLLNQIRLNGENAELVDSIISLSLRYGIITPYTSFLLDENDILSQTGRADAEERFAEQAQSLSGTTSGAAAVGAADLAGNMAAASAPLPMSTMTPMGTMTPNEGGLTAEAAVSPVQTVDGTTFLLQDGIWTDTRFQPDTMETVKVTFLSDDYFALLAAQPELAAFFALGEQVIVVTDGAVYQVLPADA